MYTIHADGQLLFDSLSEKPEDIALSPKLSLDVNKAGSLSFVLPPGNRLHGKLQKLKSLVTVEQDGVQLARSRVMETETDIYNQQRIYCEGEKAFLLDSVHAPYSYSGTVQGLFRKLIENHNSMADAEKQFTIGEITAVSGSETTEVECTIYASTSSEIEDRLLNAYGGYLRTRTVNGTHYIDWVEQYGDVNAQPIEFSVNLLDLTDKIDAGDVFTVLIPLGASEIGEDGEYTDPVSIASVNNGLNYIQDDAAVAMYGKIWKTRTWSYEDDPAKLLEKAREYLKTGIALETITLKAIDMHFTDGKVKPIRIGDRVRILSNPHGLDKVLICSQIEIDLLNPENTVYTFGERPRTLTENVVKAEEEVEELTGRGGGGGGRKSVQEEVSDIIRWAKINVDEANAHIQLTAGELNKLSGNVSAVQIELDGVEAEVAIAASRLDNVEDRTTSAEIALNGMDATIKLHASAIEDHGKSITDAEIAIDGLEAEILLKADKTVTDELSTRVTNAEIAIDGAEAAIALKADATVTDELGNRISSAEIDIDGMNSTITLHAQSIEDHNKALTAAEIIIDGLNSEILLKADKTYVDNLVAQYVKTEDFESETLKVLDEARIADLKSLAFSCSGTGTISTLYVGTGAVIPSLVYKGALLDHANLTMGDLVSATVLNDGSDINLAHSHAVTVNDDGTITLGEVSSSGGTFKIADTSYYKDGVSAAYEDGKTDGYNSGYTQGYYSVDISQGEWGSDNTKRVTATNQKYLTVDASGIYTNGYNAGNSAGYNYGHSDGYEEGVLDGYDNGYKAGKTDGYDAAKDDATVSISITKFRQTSATKVELEVKAYARINGETVATGTKTQSLTIVLET